MFDPLWPTDIGPLLRLIKTTMVFPATEDPEADEILFGIDVNGIPCIQDENGDVFCFSIAESGDALGFSMLHLLPQPATGSSTPGTAKGNNASFGVRAIAIFDFDLLQKVGVVAAGKLIFSAQMSAAGNVGEVRLFNRTDATVLALKTVPAGTTSFTLFEEPLTSIPASGIKILELQMRRVSGGGNVEVEAAMAEFVQEAI